MRTSKFLLVDKQGLGEILPDLFKILHSNMTLIAPTNNSYEDDMKIWMTMIVPAMESESRQIVRMYVDDELAGFFQYDIKADSLMMEQIQIKEEFRGTGLFSEFYRWLVKQLPKDIKNVEAYAHKNNFKSQSVLEHLGLVKMGENKNGISFYYKGKYADLLKRYS